MQMKNHNTKKARACLSRCSVFNCGLVGGMGKSVVAVEKDPEEGALLVGDTTKEMMMR